MSEIHLSNPTFNFTRDEQGQFVLVDAQLMGTQGPDKIKLGQLNAVAIPYNASREAWEQSEAISNLGKLLLDNNGKFCDKAELLVGDCVGTVLFIESIEIKPSYRVFHLDLYLMQQLHLLALAALDVCSLLICLPKDLEAKEGSGSPKQAAKKGRAKWRDKAGFQKLGNGNSGFYYIHTVQDDVKLSKMEFPKSIPLIA